jgi:hypothetical protein
MYLSLIGAAAVGSGMEGKMRSKRPLAVSVLALGLTALCAGPANAAAGSADTSIGAASKSGAKDTSRRICKSVVPTGTRVSKRDCRTQAEWDEQAASIQKELERRERELYRPEAQDSPM